MSRISLSILFESVYIPECKPAAKAGRRLATIYGVVRSLGGEEKYYMRSSYASEYSDRVSVSERQTRSGGVGCGSAGGSPSVVVQSGSGGV